MGDPVSISLALRSNPARNRQAGTSRLINCHAEETKEDGKYVWTLYGTPGLVNFGSALSGGAIRAMIVVGSLLYVVAGRDIYTVSSTGTATRIGGIPTDGPVYVERNRKIPPQIGLVSDGLFYVVDTTANSVTQVNDPDLPAPISLSVLDGYGVLPVSNGRFYLTAVDDFTSIDGLDQSQAEAYPDDIVRSAVLERELVLFGSQSIEWFQDTGGSDFPFTRVHAIELGCLSGDSVAKVDTKERKTLIWVAPDHTVRQMSGYSGIVISTPEIEKLIKDLHLAGNISEIRATAWADAGRFYYSLSSNSWTRVYDSSGTGSWHERQSYSMSRWRVGQVIQFGTKTIASDYATGQLYELRGDAYDEAGQPLIAEIQTPHVHAFPYRIQMNGLYLDAARGVGINSSSDYIANPKVMISWSRDSGLSWSAERERSLGTLGQSAKRIQPVLRLGSAGQHGVIFRLRLSAPVDRVMMSASLDFDKLSA